MRVANHAQRAVLVVGPQGHERAVDVADLSAGRFGPDVTSLYPVWDDFCDWAATVDPGTVSGSILDPTQLGAPSPRPQQIVAVGLNYAAHAVEAGFEPPADLPPIFPKWQTALTGPHTVVALPEGKVDWEVELVAVIGRTTHRITADEARSSIAGVTLGQDLSERVLQMTGSVPQFGLGKSHPGFAPTGPWLATPDEFDDLDDIALGCAIDEEIVQQARSSQMIFSIPDLVARLSQVLVLQPGDLIFTGTPDGVGMGRSPQRFLRPGEVLRTWADGLGEMTQTFVSAGS